MCGATWAHPWKRKEEIMLIFMAAILVTENIHTMNMATVYDLEKQIRQPANMH